MARRDTQVLAIVAVQLSAHALEDQGNSSGSLPTRGHARAIVDIGMALEQGAVLCHQLVDTLGVDQNHAVGSPPSLEERGDLAAPIGWPCAQKGSDGAVNLDIAPVARALLTHRGLTAGRAIGAMRRARQKPGDLILPHPLKEV